MDVKQTKLLLLCLFLIVISISSSTSTPRVDHSFELISTDHFLSMNDPTFTPRTLLALRLQRQALTSSRAVATAGQSDTDTTVESGFQQGYDAYFIRMAVGTPPKDIYMSIDTANDLCWLQCTSNKSDSIFDPRYSSTYSTLACGDPRCKQLQPDFYGCGGQSNNTCLYSNTFSDGSSTGGEFSTETLRFGRTTTLNNISIGCARDNKGVFKNMAGKLSLGRSNPSFLKQTSDQFDEIFSYCLASWNSTNKSYLVLGPSAVSSKAVYTPLINTNMKTLYYVNLTGISVGGVRVLSINSSVFDLKSNGDGGVTVEAGTTFTRLVRPAYDALRDAFWAATVEENKSLKLGSPSGYFSFDTCYNVSMLEGEVRVPTVELHFDGGASLALIKESTWYTMNDNGTDWSCFAFLPHEWYTVIGNLQQQTFQVVYDLQGSRVGFVPDSC